MKKECNLIYFGFLCFLTITISCSDQSSIEELGKMVVKSIKTKNAEQYYSLFPNSEQVAKYGIFAYGLYGSTREDMAFWMRPYKQYSKSVDSLEKVTRGTVIKGINQMFDEFHSRISWNKVEIEGIDTSETRIEEIGNLKDHEKVTSITSDMRIYLNVEDNKYVISCRDIMFIEGEGWFLRNAAAVVKLENND